MVLVVLFPLPDEKNVDVKTIFTCSQTCLLEMKQLLGLVDPRRAGQDANLAPPKTRSPPPALVEVPQALPRGLWFRAFLQRATAAERVDLRGSELLPQDVETMWTTAARSDGRRRAMAGQAHRLLLVRPGRPRSCPLLWAAAAWLPVGCRWFVVFPLGGQKKWLLGLVDNSEMCFVETFAHLASSRSAPSLSRALSRAPTVFMDLVS